MIPNGSSDIVSFKTVSQPSKTFAFRIDQNRLISTTDGLDAVTQAVYLILSTERYAYPIYSWNYGVELKNLVGKPIYYALSEIKRRITDALMQDDRILSVDDFSFEKEKRSVHVSFTVHSSFGDISAESVVEI